MTLKTFLALIPNSIPKTKMTRDVPQNGDIVCGWVDDSEPKWWYWYNNRTLTNQSGKVINSSWSSASSVWVYREEPANLEWGEESP